MAEELRFWESRKQLPGAWEIVLAGVGDLVCEQDASRGARTIAAIIVLNLCWKSIGSCLFCGYGRAALCILQERTRLLTLTRTRCLDLRSVDGQFVACARAADPVPPLPPSVSKEVRSL